MPETLVTWHNGKDWLALNSQMRLESQTWNSSFYRYLGCVHLTDITELTKKAVSGLFLGASHRPLRNQLASHTEIAQVLFNAVYYRLLKLQPTEINLNREAEVEVTELGKSQGDTGQAAQESKLHSWRGEFSEWCSKGRSRQKPSRSFCGSRLEWCLERWLCGWQLSTHPHSHDRHTHIHKEQQSVWVDLCVAQQQIVWHNMKPEAETHNEDMRLLGQGTQVPQWSWWQLEFHKPNVRSVVY